MTRTMPTFADYESARQAEGYEQVLVRQWGPDHQTGPHTHEFDASGLVVDGEMWIACEDRTLHLLPGDTFELARGTPHAERYGPQGAVYWAARRSVSATAR